MSLAASMALGIGVVAAEGAANTPPAAPTGLRAAQLEEAYSVAEDRLNFSWIVHDADKDEYQTAYRIVFSGSADDAASGTYLRDTGWVASNKSSAVTVSGLWAQLSAGSLYYWQVQTKDKDGAEGPLSDPEPFTTALGTTGWTSTKGYWVPSKLFMFARYAWSIADLGSVDKIIVTAAAYEDQSLKQHVFDMSVNGVEVGVGPARNGLYGNSNSDSSGRRQFYNSYDITPYVVSGANALGFICYNVTGAASRQFLAQVTTYYKDGTKSVSNSSNNASDWKAKDGTNAFGQDSSTYTYIAYTASRTSSNINQEKINGAQYPFGFDTAGYEEDSTWNSFAPGAANVYGNCSFAPYPSENSRRYIMPALLAQNTGAGKWLVTLEKEVVGSLRVTLNLTSDTNVTFKYSEAKSGTSVRQNAWNNGMPDYNETWAIPAGGKTVLGFQLKNFRYIEVSGVPSALTAEDILSGISGWAVRQPFDDEESGFTSSNDFLNELYEFGKYTIKATNQDLWTDSQARERAAYEGDAIVNMFSSNAYESDYTLGRHTAEYLADNPTWPKDYHLYTIEMIWKYYMNTGDKSSIENYYEKLKSSDILTGTYNSSARLVNMAVFDGNNQTNTMVDWPDVERDGYYTQSSGSRSDPYNTVHNAVYSYVCQCLANMAAILGKTAERAAYQTLADDIKAGMIARLYNASTGGFSDSCSSSYVKDTHYAQHATAYALAYGIYDSQEMAEKMAAFLDSQGAGDAYHFRAGVYGSFFVLRGLFGSGNSDAGMRFLANTDDSTSSSSSDGHTTTHHNFYHMLHSLGATLATEAWDTACKSNMTYSHAWGSAPASALTSGMFGIQPTAPAYETFDVRFGHGGIESASIKYPTIRGGIEASYELSESVTGGITAAVTVPVNTRATVYIPAGDGFPSLVVDGETVAAERVGHYLAAEVGGGVHTFGISSDVAPHLGISASVPNNGQIEFGQTAQITVLPVDGAGNAVELLPGELTFTSGDSSVAAVDADGLVSAAGIGLTTITVSAEHEGLRAEAAVTIIVVKPPGYEYIQSVEIRLSGPPVTGGTLTPSMFGVYGEGIEAEFTDAAFESSDTSIARVNQDGTVTILAAGQFKLTGRSDMYFDELDPAYDFDKFEITPIYENDFSAGSSPFANTTLSGGRVYVNTSRNSAYNIGGGINDYILTADIEPVAGTGQGDPAAGIIFRASGDSSPAGGAYMWQFRAGGNLNEHAALSVQKTVGGIGMNAAGTPTSVAIAAEGSRIMTYVKGARVDTSSYANYTTGSYIGVRTGGYEQFYLDNLVVGTRKLAETGTFAAVDAPSLTLSVSLTANGADARVDYTGQTPRSAILLAALCNAEGRLVQLISENVTISGAGGNTLALAFDPADKSGWTVKAFLWDGDYAPIVPADSKIIP
ncbi:MAG: hypothetical protein LBK41_09185 [Clostridiales bacterium]|nr:hypothetical protein [Clostridiales bacterium]